MLKTESATDSLLRPGELSQRLNKTMMLSSQEMGWNGILVEQHHFSIISGEKEVPALSDHWLFLPLVHPITLRQKSDGRWHESIFRKGDSLLVPAGQPISWHCLGSKVRQTELNIHLRPKLVEQVAEASEIDTARLNLMNHLGQQDLNLQHIAMLLLAEVQSGGMMGRLSILLG